MNSIFETIKIGNAKERLAIVADLSGVVGVSLAAVIGLIVTLPKTINVLTLAGNLFFSLIAISLLSVALAIVIMLTQYLNVRYKSSLAINFSMIICLWSAWLAAIIFVSLFYAKLIKLF